MSNPDSVQHVGQHDLNMCCGTTCDKVANLQYVKQLEQSKAELAAQVKQLASAIYNAAIGQVSMGYNIDGEEMAQFAYEVTGINAEECNWLCHLHPDDQAVDRFASAMKIKLSAARDKGRCGWDDKENCSGEHLARLLLEHMRKTNAGTFEDVANFAMMLHQRDDSNELLAQCLAEHDREVAARAVEATIDAAIDLGYLENDAIQCKQIRNKIKSGEVKVWTMTN